MTGMHIDRARPEDKAELESLYRASYGTLLAADYPPELMRRALPLLAGVNDDLVRSGSYYVVRNGEGRMVGAGGWTHAEPGTGIRTPGHAHIRHFAVDPSAGRCGIGRGLFEKCLAAAGDALAFECFSTRTAVPFYRTLGFEPVAEILLAMAPGLDFPSVRMIRIPRKTKDAGQRRG